MQVFVLDTNRKPLDPCTPARARILLAKGRASVFRRYPFTIILHDRKVEDSVVHEHRVKIDPGSKTTGVAIVQEETGQVVAAVEIEHRGQAIKASLVARAALRGARRARKTRYRRSRSKAEAENQRLEEGQGLAAAVAPAPGFQRADLGRLGSAVSARSLPRRKSWSGSTSRRARIPRSPESSTSKGNSPGTRSGSTCSRSGTARALSAARPTSRSRSSTSTPRREAAPTGSATSPWRARRATPRRDAPVEAFLKDEPGRLAKRIQAQAKAPLKDATAVNATRWELFRRLQATGLPVECGSGGRTKWNRTTRSLPKTHWLDAACVGASTPEHLGVSDVRAPAGHGVRAWLSPAAEPEHVRMARRGTREKTKALVRGSRPATSSGPTSRTG